MGGRIIRVEKTYVVRFKVLRAADGGDCSVPIAMFAESPRTGTVAASAVKAKHMITTVDTKGKMCMMKSILTSLSECGSIQTFAQRALTATRWSHMSLIKWLTTEQRVNQDTKAAGENRNGRKRA